MCPQSREQPVPGVIDRSLDVGDRLFELFHECFELADERVERLRLLVAHVF